MSRDLAQTALSDGFGPALHDFADVVDIASLAHARRRHMRRQAMDAVDHLIALLDALDAGTEGCEPDDDADPVEIHGEGDPLEDAEDDGSAEPSLGAPERHPAKPLFSHHFRSEDGRQLLWAAGSTRDVEEDVNDGPQDEDELDDDGLSRGEGDRFDDEPSLGAVEWQGDGDNWRLSGLTTLPGGHVDVEGVNEDGDPGALPWWDRADRSAPAGSLVG